MTYTTFYCPACGKQTAIWQSDFDAEDVGYIEPGIVTFYTCSNCGAEIEVYVPTERGKNE
jgi:predicted RNA-binding Zn-ribbon protein involved in translation (DUF1610 family)